MRLNNMRFTHNQKQFDIEARKDDHIAEMMREVNTFYELDLLHHMEKVSRFSLKLIVVKMKSVSPLVLARILAITVSSLLRSL